MNSFAPQSAGSGVCVRCQRPLAAGSASDTCEWCATGTAPTVLLPSAATSNSAAPTNVPMLDPAQRYQRLEVLGRGGMGEVYRARQTDLDRIVALKVVLPERCGDPMFLARFRREAVAMGRLNHPHIVAIHDFGELDGRPYLAMEFVAGTSLRARLRHGALPPQEVMQFARQLCDALAYAHALGIVHRDLKPENILVTSGGQIKVADFGLAKLVDEQASASLTAEGMILGTLRYMAPEQLAGTRDVDARADVYSLAVVLYEMFTGKVPVGRFRPPSELVAISRHFDAPLLKALDPEPDQRFPSARELGEAFERAARGESPLTATDSHQPSDVVAGNVPRASSALVGREDERQLLRARLATQRLITLTGPGGTGKSRLAMQLGLDAAGEFPDGVWFVPLAELTDPRRVPAMVASTLGVHEDGRETMAALGAHLANRTTLVILDNFEQITAASPTVSALLAAAPRLRVLVTSRTALRVSGESEFAVGPLSLPSDRTSAAAPSLAALSPAVALFVERARAVRPEFQITPANVGAIVEICRRLDGLPLAIELAAARVKLLDVESLATRLSSRLKVLTGGARDLPARQQTMRAAIAWSYDLLTPPQRTLLAWLTVFRGSFTVTSAEQLVARLITREDVPLPSGGEPVEEFDVLDALTALVDQNLLRQAVAEPTPRFAFYETVREFGEEQLRQVGSLAPLAHEHSAWCLDTVTRCEPELTGSNPTPVLAQYDCELPDYRAALAWCRGAGDRPDDALRIIGELWYYWTIRRHGEEGIEEVTATVEHPGVTRDTPAYSRALHALGTLHYLSDHPSEARQILERALDIRRRLEPEDKVFATLGNLASVKRATGDLAGSLHDLQEVLAYRRRVKNPRATAVVLSNIGLAQQFVGQFENAQASLSEALQLYDSIGDRRGMSRQQLNVGRMLHMQQRFVEALQAFEAARALSQEIGDEMGAVNARLAIANSLTALDRFDEARQAFADVETVVMSDDSESRRASFFIARGYFHWRTGDILASLSDYRACVALRTKHHDWQGCGEVAVLLAQVFCHQRRMRDAARLLGAESRCRQESGYVVDEGSLNDLQQTQATALAALGETEFRATYDEGREWPFERIVARVMSDDPAE